MFSYQLKLIYKTIYDKENDDIIEIYSKLDKDILNILENKKHNLLDYLNKYFDKEDYKIDIALYQIQDYIIILKDILEMFFEPYKWFEQRKKFLLSKDGNNYLKIYEKYCMNR